MKKILLAMAVGMLAASCNKQILDFNYKFSKACIRWPDGTMKEIEVKKWNDYEQSDTVQIIGKDGKTYLTHYSNVVLISE